MIINGHIRVIVSTSEDFGILVQHRGIIFKNEDTQYVLHQTFSGPEIITLKEYLEKRTKLWTKSYELKHEVDTDQVLADPRFEFFDLYTANCENFVNTFINEHTTTRHYHASQQIVFWPLLILALLIMNRKR